MELQIDALKLLSREKSLYSKIMTYMLEKPQDMYIVDDFIDHFKQEKPSFQSDSTFRHDIVQFFNRLEKYGSGVFTAGRRQQKSRFYFSPGIVSLLKQEFHKGQHFETKVQTEFTSQVQSAEMTEHEFLLRRGMKVKITLPVDLSEQEANRVADFIKTLPID